jgi:hypothetical protein
MGRRLLFEEPTAEVDRIGHHIPAAGQLQEKLPRVFT